MSNNIKEIHIHAYKGIHELRLTGLNQINILTGKNNSGKTSILELLATIANPGQLSSWLNGLRVNSSPYLGYYRYNSYYEGIINLFPCNVAEKQICYDYLDEDGQNHNVQMSGRLFSDQLPESELSKMNGFTKKGNNKETEEFIDVNGIEIVVMRDAKELCKEVIYDKQRRLPRTMRTASAREILYISPVEHEEYNKYLNAVFQNSEYYGLLIKMLKYFDEGLIGINAVKSDEDVGVVNYVVQSSVYKQSLPLSAYGDGMKKSVLLLSALLQAKDGILLIDEFETGIHSSCMEQVFGLLLENAISLNVQVFMTTHSKEALDKVIHTSSHLQKKINLYTLYKREGQNLVRAISSQEAVEFEDELGLELR